MWACVGVLQSRVEIRGSSLGKRRPIVHINVMSDQDETLSDAPLNATPQYRVRKPDGETSAPKSAQNTAEIDPATASAKAEKQAEVSKAKEIGGPKGPEPTRFGDWERDGRCVDF